MWIEAARIHMPSRIHVLTKLNILNVPHRSEHRNLEMECGTSSARNFLAVVVERNSREFVNPID